MTACREFRELMSASLDQALKPDEQARLQAHLDGCEECRAALKEFQALHSQIRGLEGVHPPPWMASKIMARIRAEARPSFWARFIRPLILKPQFQVATILLLAGTSYYLLRTKESAGRFADQAAPKTLAPEAKESAQAAALSPKPAEAQNQPRERKDEGSFAPPPPVPSPPASAVPAPAPAKLDAAASVAGGVSGTVTEDRLADQKSAEAPKQESAGAPLRAQSAAPAPILEKTARSEPSGNLARRDKKASPAPGGYAPEEQGKPKDSESDSRATESLVIVWAPEEPASARRSIEKELSRLGATEPPPREGPSKRTLTFRIDSQRLPELLERLGRLGRILEGPDRSKARSGFVTVSIQW